MKRFILILSVFLAVSVLGFGQVDLQPVATVALHESESISVGDFKQYIRYEMMMQMIMLTGSFRLVDLSKMPDDEKREALTQMARLYMYAQTAKKAIPKYAKLSSDQLSSSLKKEIDDEFKNFVELLSKQVERNLTTPKEIEDALQKEAGISVDLFKKIMERNLLVQEYVKPKFDAAVAKNYKQPTDKDIESKYNELKNKSTFDGGFTQPNNIRVRMLGVSYRNAAERSAAQTTINNLSRKIGRDVGEFDEADQDSRNGNAAYRGLDEIVYNHEYSRERLGDALVDTVFKLKQGEVSGVLEVPNGFCIIKAIKVLRARSLDLEDIVATVPDPQNPNRVRPVTVRDIIVQRESMQRLGEVQNQLIVELVEELKKSGGSVEITEDTYSKISW